jgi:uncharacterized membrane protein YeaQ/YmgE (transglycosylase-associated protein family)
MIAGTNAEQGAIANVMIGILGALIGGFLFNILGGTGITGFNLWSLLVAIGGSTLLIMLLKSVRHA